MKKKLFQGLVLLGLLTLTAPTVFASGFAIIEQSVSGLGNAFAGGAAVAEDATTVFFNPAGMTRLEGQQFTAGAHVIVPSAKFTVTAAPTNAAGAPIRDSAGTPITSGSSAGDSGQTGVVPNLYYTNKLSNKLSIGLGINAPFGLATEYDKTWAGRYHAVESAVATININPNVAYQVNKQLSVAAGVSAQYIDVTLSSMVDGSLIDGTFSSSPNKDIFVENKADDWGFGFNLGMLYQFSENTRAGVSYHSEIEHKVEGEVTSQLPVAMLPYAALFQTQTINGSITLPASVSVSLYHRLNDRLSLMGDVSWTGWSSFDKLVINFEGTGIATQTSSTTTENWKDTWRYAIGASFRASDALILRTGLAYDQSPISDEYRTPRIPGNDRTWISLGAGYRFTQSINMDLAYAHLFVPNSKFSKTATLGTEDQGRGTVQGEYENAVDIASIQLTYSF